MIDHRTLSEAYIEDSFATLSSRAVVENLTYVKGDLTGFFPTLISFSSIQTRQRQDPEACHEEHFNLYWW